MSDTLKQEKTRGCLGCVVVLIIASIIIFFIMYPFFQKQDLLTVSSPDNSYEIIIKYEAAFMFGPQEITVYYRENNEIFKHRLFTTLLFNDGGTINESNCDIKWNNNIAKIEFTGDEQEPELYKIDFSKKVKYEKIIK